MPTQAEHIAANEDAYWAAYDRAMVALKGDQRFTGLDKTRRHLAHEAALDATGWMPGAQRAGVTRPLILPRQLGRLSEEFLRMCEEGLVRARAAAKGTA